MEKSLDISANFLLAVCALDHGLHHAVPTHRLGFVTGDERGRAHESSAHFDLFQFSSERFVAKPRAQGGVVRIVLFRLRLVFLLGVRARIAPRRSPEVFGDDLCKCCMTNSSMCAYRKSTSYPRDFAASKYGDASACCLLGATM